MTDSKVDLQEIADWLKENENRAMAIQLKESGLTVIIHLLDDAETFWNNAAANMKSAEADAN